MNDQVHRRIDLLVRSEYGQLVAHLVARLGGHNLDLAEDVAQEALVAALANWPYKGIPDYPAAWLKTVARNRAIDRLRREGRESEYDEATDRRSEGGADNVFAARIPDPELRLILLCCHPALGEEDRLCLTLKVVSGFTARDISSVLLKAETAIAQRLARAKRKLRDPDEDLDNEPSRFQISERLETVLKVVYLMFSLGYAPRSGEQLVRHDICREALRLATEIADNDLTVSPQAHALAALLCFQASRLGAREDENGLPVLMRDQDRGHWDRQLIDQGLGHLSAAQAGPLSRYHLEAGIASLHSTADDWASTDWDAMVRLYDALEKLTGSPVVSINACVAQAMAGNAEAALQKLDGLAGEPAVGKYGPFHIARAEVLRLLHRHDEANACYVMAMEAGVSEPVLADIEDRLSHPP